MTRPIALVLGAGGMLGHKVVQTLAHAGDLSVHAATRRRVLPGFVPEGVEYSTDVDLSAGSGSLGRLLERLRPDFIVNSVGAIKQKDLAAAIDDTFYLNATLPHLLPLLNPNRDCRVIHISTDCVFDGTKGGYRDDDRPDALDLYGRSKAVGEIDYGRHLTIRTSIIGFELGGHLGLLSWFFRQPPGSTLKGFTKAIYSGLPTVTLSRVIHDAITSRRSLCGLFHVASAPIDKYDLLIRVNRAFELGHHIEPDASLQIDRSLDDTRYRAATATPRPGWETLIDDLKADFASWPYDRVYGELRATAGHRS